ncbi:MAG: hypothetical protein AB7P17_14450 [Nitrospirales bacterium]
MPYRTVMLVMPITWCLLPTLIMLAEISPSNSVPEQNNVNRPGIPPGAFGDCPETHPIKGNFTTHSGERCIYHLPGQHFHRKTKAERCYATEDNARQDECRKSKR